MKLLIADDMEGISGVVSWDHVTSTHPEYQRFRRIMTAEVNAAVAGAVKAGVEDIVIADGHSGGKNVLVEELDSHARINSGSPSLYAMVTGADDKPDAAIFIGYHARAGTPQAILAHTWSSGAVFNVWLNDRLCGEIGLNASLCGHFGVPVLFLSGDQAACNEAREWIPGIETVVVKKAGGFQAAECLPPEVSQRQIKETVERALINFFVQGRGAAALKPGSPVKVAVELMHPSMADAAVFVPGVNRLDGRKVEFTASDMPTAQHTFRAVVTLAGTV